MRLQATSPVAAARWLRRGCVCRTCACLLFAVACSKPSWLNARDRALCPNEFMPERLQFQPKWVHKLSTVNHRRGVQAGCLTNKVRCVADPCDHLDTNNRFQMVAAIEVVYDAKSCSLREVLKEQAGNDNTFAFRGMASAERLSRPCDMRVTTGGRPVAHSHTHARVCPDCPEIHPDEVLLLCLERGRLQREDEEDRSHVQPPLRVDDEMSAEAHECHQLAGMFVCKSRGGCHGRKSQVIVVWHANNRG